MVNLRIIFIGIGMGLLAVVFAGPMQSPPTTPPASELAELFKNGEPTARHRELDSFVGTWNQNVRCWLRPDAPPIESTMTAEYAWVLDGRYIEGRCRGTLLGKPFEAIEIRGFDNASGCFTLQWFDNLGTSALIAAGQFDAQSRVFSLQGEKSSCPQAGEVPSKPTVAFRTATHLVGSDRMIFEIFSSSPEGREFRSLQVISARREP